MLNPLPGQFKPSDDWPLSSIKSEKLKTGNFELDKEIQSLVAIVRQRVELSGERARGNAEMILEAYDNPEKSPSLECRLVDRVMWLIDDPKFEERVKEVRRQLTLNDAYSRGLSKNGALNDLRILLNSEEYAGMKLTADNLAYLFAKARWYKQIKSLLNDKRLKGIQLNPSALRRVINIVVVDNSISPEEKESLTADYLYKISEFGKVSNKYLLDTCNKMPQCSPDFTQFLKYTFDFDYRPKRAHERPQTPKVKEPSTSPESTQTKKNRVKLQAPTPFVASTSDDHAEVYVSKSDKIESELDSIKKRFANKQNISKDEIVSILSPLKRQKLIKTKVAVITRNACYKAIDDGRTVDEILRIFVDGVRGRLK